MRNYELPNMKYPEQKGLISIIVPIYNCERYLRECLDSVLAQTFTNWEAILVNDGSTDGTGKIIDEYAAKDSRFIAIHKPQNENALLARKTGLENSRGEFITNLDSDDTYDPRSLEKMYAKITETNSDFVWCKLKFSLKNMEHYITNYEWNEDVSENVAMLLTPYTGTSWNMCGILIKRKIYAKVNFPNEHLFMGDDMIQSLQIAHHSKSAAFVPEFLYIYRPNGYSTIESARNRTAILRLFIIVNEILENLFNGIIPTNVKNSLLHCAYSHDIAVQYFYQNKKIRLELKNEIEPFILENIKREKRLIMKTCYILANNGIMLPFWLGSRISSTSRWLKKRLRLA